MKKTILAQEHGDIALTQFDQLLDPFEMYYIKSDDGMSRRVWTDMVQNIHPGIIRVIQDTCAAFAEFSNWRFEREKLPDDWKDRREEIESENELRYALMSHLTRRIMNFCSSNVNAIVEWKRNRALKRWAIIRTHMISRQVSFFWLEYSQRKHHEEDGTSRNYDKSMFEKEFSNLLSLC